MTSLAELTARFRDVGLRDVSAHARTHDAAHAFNREAWRRVGTSGLFGLHVKKELGGEGLGLKEWAAAILGFAEGSGDLGFSVSVVAHAGCLVTALQEFGSPAQLKRLMPKLISGEWVGAVANAEPRGGTDVLSLLSRARRTASGYQVHARKRCITNVGPADLVCVSARLDSGDEQGPISIFLLDGRGPRVWQRPVKDLMGLRTSPTGDLLAWRAPVGTEALLGQPGDGVRFFRTVFALERLFIGYLYLASIRRSLSRAVQQAETRVAFGDVLGKNQYVQDKIVRMRTAEELLAALLDKTMDAHLAGEDVSAQLSIIKSWGVDVARQSAEDLVGLLGYRGMRQSERAEKDFRDLMGLSILGGTQELQKMVIYRETVKARTSAPRPPLRASDTEGLTIEVKSLAEVDRALEASLIEVAARALPDEASVKGRWYYDSVPDLVVLARLKGRLAGFRIISRRTVRVGERSVRLAGIGIAVDPEFQRRGIGKALTRATLDVLRSQGDEVAAAFLLNRTAEPLLQAFGFRRLDAQLSYTQRGTQAQVAEQMPCYALALNEGDGVLAAIEAARTLHLGLGTW